MTSNNHGRILPALDTIDPIDNAKRQIQDNYNQEMADSFHVYAQQAVKDQEERPMRVEQGLPITIRQRDRELSRPVKRHFVFKRPHSERFEQSWYNLGRVRHHPK